MIGEHKGLKEALKAMLIRRLRIEEVGPDDIEDHAPLFGEGLGLDSVDALELVVGLEQEFGVTVADAEVGRRAFASIAALAQYVDEKRPS